MSIDFNYSGKGIEVITKQPNYINVVCELNQRIFIEPYSQITSGENIIINFKINEINLKNTGIFLLSPNCYYYNVTDYNNVSIETDDGSVPYYDFTSEFVSLIKEAEVTTSLANKTCYLLKFSLSDYDNITKMNGKTKILSVNVALNTSTSVEVLS